MLESHPPPSAKPGSIHVFSCPSRQGGAGGAGAGANSNSPNKVFRSTEWRLAADKLDQMIGDTGTPTEREGFGAVCGWDEAVFRLETSDFISVTGDTAYTREQKNGGEKKRK